MAAITQTYGTYTTLSTTSLQTLTSSTTTFWQSALIDNQSSVKAIDYEIMVQLNTANTAPANDKAIYIYTAPAMTTDGGTTWILTDIGTTTALSTTEGTVTVSSNGNLKIVGILNYVTAKQPMNGVFNLSNATGGTMPDGFVILINNYCGANLSGGTTSIVAYRSIANAIA